MQEERGGNIQLLTLEIGLRNKRMPCEPGYFLEKGFFQIPAYCT